MGGTPDTWVTPDSDSSCSESAAANTSAGKGCFMGRWGSFPSGGGVGGGRFAARTVAVRSYPRVRSSPHLPYQTYTHQTNNERQEDPGMPSLENCDDKLEFFMGPTLPTHPQPQTLNHKLRTVTYKTGCNAIPESARLF